jgi:hypothetical protein
MTDYHEMRTQTLHQLECQNPLTSPKADLPLTRKGPTAIPATKVLIK